MKTLLLTITLTFLSLSTLYAQTPESIQITHTLTTIDDNKTININETKEGLNFQEFQGKAVLLTLFGHRCPPCIREIPEFIALTKKYKDSLSIVAVESQNSPVNEVKAFKKEYGMNYNVVAGIDHKEFIDYIAERAGYSGSIPLPLLIAIDKHGVVQYLHAGELSQDELESLVKELNK